MTNQKIRGYPLPDDPETALTTCVKFQIPDLPEYRWATTGAVHELAKWHVWERDPDKKASVATMLFKRLLLETFTIGECEEPPPPVEECDNLDFQQIGCKLYYSKDSGESWILMFDYEVCFAGLQGDNPADTIIINGATEDELQRLLDMWNNNQRPDDGAIDPVFWDVAVCLAVHSIINGIMQALLERRAQADSFDLVGLITGGVLTGLSVIDLLFKAITWKLTLAVGILVSGWASLQWLSRDEIVNIPLEEFTSQTLLDELRGQMYDSLKQVAPSLSTYQQSLDDVAPVTANAIKIRNWIRDGFTLESFIGFLQMVRILHDFAKAENFLENPCANIDPCDAITWNFPTLEAKPDYMRLVNVVPGQDGTEDEQPFEANRDLRINPAKYPLATNIANRLVVYITKRCSRPITVSWLRGNLSSASCTIEVYENNVWVVKASSAIALNTASSFVRTFTWTPPAGYNYDIIRIRATTSDPRIRTITFA